jgi:serine/threonine protein kinase
VLRADPSFEELPWPSVSTQAKDFVKRLLNKDLHRRMTASQALSMPLSPAGSHYLGSHLTSQIRCQCCSLEGKKEKVVLQQVLSILHTPGNNKCKRFGGGAVHPWIVTNEKVPLDILVYRLVRNYLRSSSMKRAALKVSNLSPHYELWVLHTVHRNMYQVSH